MSSSGNKKIKTFITFYKKEILKTQIEQITAIISPLRQYNNIKL